MNKQVVRQVQQNGSRFDVCFAPEVREALCVKKGDNVSFEIDPDSEIVKMSKVNPANPDLDNPQDDNRLNPENKSGENKVNSLAVRSKAVPVEDETETTIEFCVNCGSGDIEIKGDRYYCRTCDVLYEFTGKGIKPVKLNLLSEGIGNLESRIEQIEQNVRDIDERLGDESDAIGSLDWLCPRESVKVMSGADQDENENPDENDEIDDDFL